MELQGVGRFRANAFQQTRGPSVVFRTIPNKILSLEELQLPPVLKKLADFPHGLVLVTGPTGSGKTTTLAALIDLINEKNNRCIFLPSKIPLSSCIITKSLINQREVGEDTLNFGYRTALCITRRSRCHSRWGNARS